MPLTCHFNRHPMGCEVVKGKPLYVGLAEKRDVRAERLRVLIVLVMQWQQM